MTNVGYATIILNMMKIKEYSDFTGVSMYRIAMQMEIRRKKDETEEEYDRRRRGLVWSRHKRGWEMSYKDKSVSMRPHKDAEIKVCRCDLDDFIKVS